MEQVSIKEIKDCFSQYVQIIVIYNKESSLVSFYKHLFDLEYIEDNDLLLDLSIDNNGIINKIHHNFKCLDLQDKEIMLYVVNLLGKQLVLS